MATEPFLVNPHRGTSMRKKSRSHPWNWHKKLTNWGKVKTHRRHVNPFGEEVMIVGNPRRKKRKNARRRGRKRNVFLNPRHYRKRGRKNSPSRRRRSGRRNPTAGLPAISLQRPMSLLPVVITGGAAVILTTAAPRLLAPMIGEGPIQRYGSQLATAFAGGWVVNRFVGHQHGIVWTVVSLATIGGQLLNEFVVGPSGLLGFGAYLEGIGDEYEYLDGDDEESLDGVGEEMDEEYAY